MDANINVDGYDIRVLEGPYVLDGKGTPEAIAFAEELISKLPAIKQFVTKQLLATYNDSWADEDHPEMNASQFEKNLTNPRIVIFDEIGAATVFFEDSDMFGGHSINVSLDQHEMTDASLAG